MPVDLFDHAFEKQQPKCESAPAPVVLNNGRDHRCRICGAPANYGFRVRLLHGIPGDWSCDKHRDQVRALG
jgi:hypothetical protein